MGQCRLRHEGLTEGLVFKGGTSLRKFVFGLTGRFSRNLDFAISDRATVMNRDGSPA
jgi:predicted nucleotidyltransferase component of viral defense system